MILAVVMRLSPIRTYPVDFTIFVTFCMGMDPGRDPNHNWAVPLDYTAYDSAVHKNNTGNLGANA